jgi:MFS family permease
LYVIGDLSVLLVREKPEARDAHSSRASILHQIKNLLSLSEYRRWAVAHLCLTASLSGLGMVTVFYQGTQGGGEGVIGTFTLVLMIAYVVGGPLAGRFGDLVGYKRTSLMMIAMYVMAFGLAVAVGQPWLALPTFILLGFGASFQEVWLINYPSELLSDQNQVQFIATSQMLASPAAFLSALVFGEWVDSGVGYRIVFWIPFLLALLALLLVLYRIPEPRQVPSFERG